MASMKKDFKKVRQEAEAQGWRVRATKKGHWQFFAPDGRTIVTAPGTPSDHRALANTISDLRRAGFKWKGR
jgi:predicted RNA binding protein YcfA (HicA-like mRNA interferase family)